MNNWENTSWDSCRIWCTITDKALKMLGSGQAHSSWNEVSDHQRWKTVAGRVALVRPILTKVDHPRLVKVRVCRKGLRREAAVFRLWHTEYHQLLTRIIMLLLVIDCLVWDLSSLWEEAEVKELLDLSDLCLPLVSWEIPLRGNDEDAFLYTLYVIPIFMFRLCVLLLCIKNYLREALFLPSSFSIRSEIGNSVIYILFSTVWVILYCKETLNLLSL